MRADAPATTSVRVVGGLLPSDLLARIVVGDVPGLTPGDYHLADGETPRAAANRAWTYILGAWDSYRQALANLEKNAPTTSLTREKWLLLLLRELGFGRVPTTPAGGLHVGDRDFPVSHIWQNVPMHLLGWDTSLDTRTKGVAGAAGSAPQSMLQELLNTDDDYLWAIISNGQQLRMLRDSTSLVGAAFIEFDIEAMFDGQLFSDFVVLFSVCHQSRFERITETADDCWLERWRADAIATGTRALELLRGGVQTALEALGTGFILANPDLRRRLAGDHDQPLRVQDFHNELLRLVYRVLFLFVIEDRGLLHHPGATQHSRDTYSRFFSTSRLRKLATSTRGTRHGDLWESLTLIFAGLRADDGLPALGLPGLGGLFDDPDLSEAHASIRIVLDRRDHDAATVVLPNRMLLAAIRALAEVKPKDGPKRTVDYRNLGAEELGGVYESLLELVPQYDPAELTFRLVTLTGNERKTTGSYYTPTSLVECLLDTALDPLLDDAVKAEDSGAALLALTVCDTACGSAHFLVAAARRIAKRLAGVRTGEAEPTPDATRHAMRDVIAHCVYGVDLNPMAIQLAKVSLWLEAVEPGRPLTFLDAHIKLGNALLGATPRLLADGLPDAAFTPIEGDDKKYAAALGKRNRAERQSHAGQGELFGEAGLRLANVNLAVAVRDLDTAETPRLSDVRLQARRYRDLQASVEMTRAREVADAWCAAFIWDKTPGAVPAVTQRVLLALDAGASDPLLDQVRDESRRLAQSYRFFHWHQEFPSVFSVPEDGSGVETPTGWTGGFSCVLGNPPWDKVELDEQEFFAGRDGRIAVAAGAQRKRLIDRLLEDNASLHADFLAAKRYTAGLSHFVRDSGRYPLTGQGRINTYAVFAEADRTLLGPHGRLGVIAPTGIATDATTQYFLRDLVESGALVSLYDFENAKPLFEGVHRSFKFCLLTLTGYADREAVADFAFFAHEPADLATPNVRFSLTPAEIILLNPNTGTCPVFRSRRDAEITLGIYRHVPVLIRDGEPDGNPWGLSFMQGLFNMTTDSALFHTRGQLENDGWTLCGNRFERGDSKMLPLYEGKMLHHYDHRWATYEYDGSSRDVTLAEKENPNFVAIPRYWVAQKEVDAKLGGRWDQPWFLGYRWVSNATNERTLIASVVARCGAGNSLPIVSADRSWLLGTTFSSLCVDYATRQKLGGQNMTFTTTQQLPVLPPATYDHPASWDPTRLLGDWIADRVLELVYTAWDVQAFALELGEHRAPFRWDDERRALLRDEMDAAYFHLYGLSRPDVDYVLDTFPILRRKDEAAFSEFRTKRVVLEIYDAMAEATAAGTRYETVLDPPPASGSRHAVPTGDPPEERADGPKRT